MCFGSKPKATSDFNNSQGQTPNTGIVDSSPRNSSSKMPTNESYSPLSGPPPAHAYAPAAGPPPSQSYAPPSGPPPGRFQPQHDWQTAVPDNSLLPPPPALFTGHDRSRTNNANEQEAEQGEAWCHYNLMLPPLYYPLEAVAAINHGEIGVVTPRGYKGTLESQRPGIWKGKTKSNSPDSCITSSIPLYSVAAHSPLNSGQPKTVYYEMRIARGNRGQVSLAMGYTAPPYPTFRLPGWHRGSLAVHGDDGSKYINDRWGGKDFTTPFRAGETLGLGMTFTRRDVDEPPTYGSAPQPTESRLIDVEIFLTRNGQKTGEWNLHEEGDAEQDLPVIGLEGLNDIFAAVGTFEAVEFEIIFNQSEWMFRP
ncbi:hypothetical protein BJ878DRAFT_410823 [Calycina marina]|uniref:SPRY domain-containing protein n=1 Tax=Calycina marina TaxID=1763456 RepID=A0A9P7ZD09_9HELO|nr:hypothetical protein BJ878DRAFT_410823 [Calycina marina]